MPDGELPVRDFGFAACYAACQRPGGAAASGYGRMTEEEERDLRSELARLRQEHSDLDAAIATMAELGRADPIRIQRMKKRKLALKDRVARIEDVLLPDIIA